MLDLNSREWVPVETYGEMILTSDNEFLSEDFHHRSLLKKLTFSCAGAENFEYCQ